MENVYKLHGLPATIVSDRDAVFLSQLWKHFFSYPGVQLHYSIAYHPQTNEKTEIVNKCLESYLKCMIGDSPNQCSKWLS